jgi:hypothetical protein
MRQGIAMAIVLLGSSWIAAPALAQYGAIAWDEETGKFGASWNQDTPKRASEKALSECGATGCKVIVRPTTVCAALATTADGKVAGAAARKNRDAARLAALKDCQKGKAGECTVRVTDCNK